MDELDILSPKSPSPGPHAFGDVGSFDEIPQHVYTQADERPKVVQSIQNTAVVLDEYLTRMEQSIASIRVKAFDESIVIPSSHILFTSRGVTGGESAGWRADNAKRKAFADEVRACSVALPIDATGALEANANHQPPAVDLLAMINSALKAPGALDEIKNYEETINAVGSTQRVVNTLASRWACVLAAWKQAAVDVDAAAVRQGATAHVALALRLLALRQFVLRKVRPKIATMNDVIILASGKPRNLTRNFTIQLADPARLDVLHVRFAAPPPRSIFSGLSVRFRVEVAENHPLVPPRLYLVGPSFEKGPCPIIHPNVCRTTGEVRIVGRWVWPTKPAGTLLTALAKATTILDDPDLLEAAVLNQDAARAWLAPDAESRKRARAQTVLSAQSAPTTDGAIAAVAEGAGTGFFVSSAAEPADPALLASQLPGYLVAVIEMLKKREPHVVELRRVVAAAEAGDLGAIPPRADAAQEKEVRFGFARGLPPAQRAALGRSETYTTVTAAAQRRGGQDVYSAVLRDRSSARLLISASSAALRTGMREAEMSLADLSRIRRSTTICAAPGSQRPRPLMTSSASVGFDDPRSPSQEVFRAAPPAIARPATLQFMEHFANRADNAHEAAGPPPVDYPWLTGPVAARADALKAAPTTQSAKTLGAALRGSGGAGFAEDILRFLAPEERLAVARTCKSLNDAVEASTSVRPTALQNVALALCWRVALLERDEALLSSRIEVMRTAAAALKTP